VAGGAAHRARRRPWRPLAEADAACPVIETGVVGVLGQILEHYSKPHIIEKKNNPRAASYASR
jgi:hypothetical protein